MTSRQVVSQCSSASEDSFRTAARSVPRPLGQAEAGRRDHLFDLDRRWALAANGLRGPARGQAGSRCGEKLHGLSRRKRTRLDQRKTVRSRREADTAGAGLGRLSWADSGHRRIPSGRTGVRAIAVVPLRARNSLHRPKRKFDFAGRHPRRQYWPRNTFRCILRVEFESFFVGLSAPGAWTLTQQALVFRPGSQLRWHHKGGPGRNAAGENARYGFRSMSAHTELSLSRSASKTWRRRARAPASFRSGSMRLSTRVIAATAASRSG